MLRVDFDAMLQVVGEVASCKRGIAHSCRDVPAAEQATGAPLNVLPMLRKRLRAHNYRWRRGESGASRAQLALAAVLVLAAAAFVGVMFRDFQNKVEAAQ